MKVRELHPLLGKRIEIRCSDFATVIANVREAEIVGNDEQDVGPSCRDYFTCRFP